MPTLAVERDALFASLGRTYTDEGFDELCFEFGVELDEITSEREEALKSITVKMDKAAIAQLSTVVIYKVDVPANRYDLLCIEGLSRALKIFLGDMDAPVYTVVHNPSKMETMTVHPSTAQIRPFVVCAILRDVTFTPERYNSFIDLQDQLHRNLCRLRTLVAIGTHDMDATVGPYHYDARAPDAIEFVPLVSAAPAGTAFKAGDLLEHYSTEVACKHLKPYVPIIQNSPVYPVVLDANDTVLSLPPIINSDHSKITLNTKNVFIECTATDLTKANIVLDTMVTMFSEYCATPFSVEPVEVNFVDTEGTVTKSYVTPVMAVRKERAPVKLVNSLIGINITAERMVELCNKIQLGPASLVNEGTELEVSVPPTRSDILHAVDICEDVGIAYGYNNIVKRVPKTCTVGGEQPLNHLGDLLREEIGRAGYIEVLTHGLCSTRDNFTALRTPVNLAHAVTLSNPANVEYQVVRTTLLPGLLKTLQHNKGASFTSGLKFFEISDVVVQDSEYVMTETIVGCKNVRRLCATYAGPTSGFEIIHGLVDRIMTLCEVAPEPEYVANSGKGDEEKFRVSREGWFYTIQGLDENDARARTYFPGRAAQVFLSKPSTGGLDNRVSIGTFGILHPEVLQNFDIQYPSSSVELNLEALL